MSKVQMLRESLNRRESAAAEEICEPPHHNLLAAPLTAEVQQVIVVEQAPCERQPPHIKEEQEELWSSQEGDDVTRFTFTAVSVKSEDEEPMEAEAEDYGGSDPARRLRVFVKQRLTAAIEEIFGMLETTLVEYEKEIEGLHKLLEEARVNTADDPKLLAIQERVSPEQQTQRPSVELWSSQEGDDVTRFTPTAVSVKSEDEEERARSSQLHLRQAEEQMKAEDCRGSSFGPARDSQQERDEKTNSSDPDTENSDDYSPEMSRPQLGLVTLNYGEGSVSREGSSPAEQLCGGETVHSRQNMSVDTGGKPFSCYICGKGFSECSNLKRHLRFHTGAKPFSCVFCEKNFTEKADLKRHMRVHTGEKPFSCPICGKGFSERTDVTRHTRVHTGEKPFSCPVCGKIFSQNENLRRHERIHTGEKPFSCPVCTKKFTHRGALVVHMRIHTGEKPFGCSVCGKRYIETGNLKKHMRVHTGEKPFSCSVCGRRFKYQSQVKKHKCSGESSVAHQS